MKKNLNRILFSLYFSLIVSLIYSSQYSLGIIFFVLIFCASFIFSFIISRFLFNLINKIKLPSVSASIDINSPIWFILFFFLSFSSMAVWYIKYYPGWFSGDSLNQLNQALSGNYNDWHPVLQTIITFTFPLTVSKGWQGSIILFQIIEYSLILAYMAKTIQKFGGNLFAFIALLFVILNPVTGAIAKQPWKDVTFAMFCVLLLTYSIHIICDQNWIHHPVNVILFCLVSVVASLMRHNGVLFTVPLVAIILWNIDSKKLLFSLICGIIILFILIKCCLYSALGVSNPGNRKVETLGLPMTIIGNVVKESPDKLDSETLSFAYSIAPPEIWQEYYLCGDFNNIKFNAPINTQPIEDAGYLKVLDYALRCFKASPKVAFKALVDVTKMVYAFSGDINWNPEFIPPKLLSPIINSSLKYIFLYIGLENLIVLLFALAKNKFFWVLPLFIHNFGTMLLLTGPDYRFFYLSYPAAPILVFLIIVSYKKDTLSSCNTS